MLRSEIKSLLNTELKTICDNVEDSFDHPASRASEQKDFPYITVVWREWRPDQLGSIYGKQSIDIIAIVTGENEDLLELSSVLEQNIINLITKNKSIKNYISGIDNTNIFQPFGLNAGVFPPYAGVRISIDIGNVSLT